MFGAAPGPGLCFRSESSLWKSGDSSGSLPVDGAQFVYVFGRQFEIRGKIVFDMHGSHTGSDKERCRFLSRNVKQKLKDAISPE